MTLLDRALLAPWIEPVTVVTGIVSVLPLLALFVHDGPYADSMLGHGS